MKKKIPKGWRPAKLEEIKPGEIVYCILTYKTKKGKSKTSKKIVYSRSYKNESKKELFFNLKDDRIFIKRIGEKEDLTILDINIIESLGFKQKTKLYTSVKKNSEERNKITGAYE